MRYWTDVAIRRCLRGYPLGREVGKICEARITPVAVFYPAAYGPLEIFIQRAEPEKRAEAAKKAGLSRRGEKHWRLPVNCGPAILSRMGTKSRETIYGAAQNRYLWCHDLVLQPPVGDRSFGLDQLARGARRDNPTSYRLPLGNQRASPCS